MYEKPVMKPAPWGKSEMVKSLANEFILLSKEEQDAYIDSLMDEEDYFKPVEFDKLQQQQKERGTTMDNKYDMKLTFINNELELDEITLNRRVYLNLLKKLCTLDPNVYSLIPAQSIPKDAPIDDIVAIRPMFGSGLSLFDKALRNYMSKASIDIEDIRDLFKATSLLIGIDVMSSGEKASFAHNALFLTNKYIDTRHEVPDYIELFLRIMDGQEVSLTVVDCANVIGVCSIVLKKELDYLTRNATDKKISPIQALMNEAAKSNPIDALREELERS